MTINSAERIFFSDEGYLIDLRRKMVRFAELQLNDRAAAEDAVQEAIAAALKNVDSFAGGAAFRTWVFAILKHKITDHFRQNRRWVTQSSLVAGDEEGDESDDLFNQRGFWHRDERPVAWAEPDDALESRYFWRVFEACLDHLPSKQARVFMMREFVGLNTDEICEAVTLSVSNLHVLLHRARLRLRECLENNWFKGAAS